MYNVCVVGFGYWGPKLARNFQNSEHFNLAAICDSNKKKLLIAKKNYPLAFVAKDYKKIINENDIDLVIVATPTSSHFKIAKYALEKSINILVEKPLTLSLLEVKKLNKIAKKKNKFIFVDYPFLFSGSILYLKKIINKKKFGNILEIESFREQAPIRRDANVIWDLATHDVSILLYLLQKLPYKIHVIKKKNYRNCLEDTAYINLKFIKNMNVLIKNSWISSNKIRIIKIKFQKAIVYCDENESLYKIKIYKNKAGSFSNQFNLEIPEIDLTEPLTNLVNYIFKVMKNKNNYLFKGNFNEKITQLLEKINK